MTFAELLVQVRELLQSKGRVSYRALKLQFNLDEEHLEGLKDELIEAERVAADEGSKVLVWVGKGINGEAAKREKGEDRPESSVQSPNKAKIKRQKSKSKSEKSKNERQPKDSKLRTSNSELAVAERRQLTVMFCDLVGSTALSAQLDPEELREVVRGYQETSAAIIERFGGHMAQYLGDGLLVYFSYPVAHEDDAARAVRAGLEIITDISQSVPSPLVGEHVLRASEGGQGEGVVGATGRSPLQVRIGIHTGPVVVGEMGGGTKREILALGETPNLAARIQGQAAPNEVVISVATYRLVEGLFECEDRGQPDLKGVSTLLTLYHVMKETDAQSRFEVVARKGLTPLIGRDHEYGLLRERWEQAKSGEGQVVLLSGEPGIGKSRLVEALKESVEHEGASCLELRCSPYHQNSALYPVIAHLQQTLQFRVEDSTDEKMQKLEQQLSRSPMDLQAALPLFASLLSLLTPRSSLPTLSPQKQKEKTLDALVDWLCAEAKQQAVVFAWEDLHWADPSTLELLTLFLNQVPTTRLLTVLIFRPEFISPWGTHSYLSQLTLSRLGRTHVETIVEKVASGKALPRAVVQQIVSKTDGVPLYVEELTKTVIESAGSIESGEKLGQSSLQFGIPATLQDALMARLDRLGPAKEIAQIGAVIGREFNYELLQAVSSLDEETLQRGLKQLVDAELMYQRGLTPQAHYLFKHVLIQDTAYQSLLKSKRQQYHQQIAQVFEARFPETKETQPELVAHHYTKAGLIEQALPHWQKAGERATQRSAYVEAISHLTKGLELLKTLPDTPERSQQELAFQVTLGAPLVVTKGQSAPEVERVYARARDLCEQINEPFQLFPVLWGLFRVYVARGEFETAHELVEQLLRLAQSIQDPAFLLEAQRGMGAILFYLGELVPARAHLEQGLALYDPQQHISHSLLYGQDPGIVCLSYITWTLWLLGYPKQALTSSRDALALAQNLSHPPSLVFAPFAATFLHQFRREGSAAQGLAEVVNALSREHGLPQWQAWGTILRGWALAEQNQREEGIALMGQGLAACQAMGTAFLRPYFLALRAETYEKVGQIEEGLSTLSKALTLVNRTGERFYEAELYRLRGELMLQQENQKAKGKSQKSKVETNPQPLTPNPQGEVEQEAEGYFQKAIEIARKQQAKSLELRATTSLARLWRQQGKQKEAHQMLSEIYNWFTEGFDTKDLQEAKALLAELSH